MFGPAGICNVCRRRCGTLDEAGIPCYHCGEGVFIHRYFWIYRPCPECDGICASLCSTCNRVGCLVIAKECELDVNELYQWMSRIGDRYRGGDVPPPLVAVTVAFARAQLGIDSSMT